MVVNGNDIGILIDCSHHSASELDQRIIRYAQAMGYGGFDEYLVTHDTDSEDYAEALRWESESALTYLNDECTDGDVVFTIEDNSLYLTLVDGD